MTERKPPDVSFSSWIDQQINEAAERGAFDNLPGTGKPLPNNGEADDGQAWLRGYLRKEGLSTEIMLPAPLKLRKETERLGAAVSLLGSEQEVRDAVADLNQRIVEWRRIPVGPPIFVPLADEEMLVSRWREAQVESRPADLNDLAGSKEPARPRWWHRLSRRH